mgnify:FL=1|jgi:DNA-binding NtrC family response regulator
MTIAVARHLLLVDDELEILDAIAGYLRRRNLLVTTASCYEQADRLLKDRSQAFDALVSDVRMPDGSGVELARSFLGRPSGGACILMTGHLEVSDLSTDLLKSGLSVIYKPFSLSALCTKIVEVLAALPNRTHAGDSQHEIALKLA